MMECDGMEWDGMEERETERRKGGTSVSRK